MDKTYFSSDFSIYSGIRPDTIARGSPPLNISRAGSLRRLNLSANSGLSSIFNVTKSISYVNSFEIFSQMGSNTVHGPHQAAQQFTATGRLVLGCSTKAPKVSKDTGIKKQPLA